MTPSDGLWIFLACTWLRVSALLIDFALLKAHCVTITEFARRNEWCAFLILSVEVIGLVGLGYHFFSREKI
jgi:hypothetical protein